MLSLLAFANIYKAPRTSTEASAHRRRKESRLSSKKKYLIAVLNWYVLDNH